MPATPAPTERPTPIPHAGIRADGPAGPVPTAAGALPPRCLRARSSGAR